MIDKKKKILLFDWDGTIVDSNHFKWVGAWQLVFEGEPDKQCAIEEVFRTPKGRVYNRWELVRETLILTDDPSLDLEGEKLREDPRITKYTDKFRDILETSYDSMPIFEKSSELLKNLKEDGYTMYVISNSATEGLKKMAKHFGVLDYFNNIYGLPASKWENFQIISQIEGTSNGEDFVYIGDGENDKALAEKIGCQFIGIANEWNGWTENPSMKDKSIIDLSEISNLV